MAHRDRGRRLAPAACLAALALPVARGAGAQPWDVCVPDDPEVSGAHGVRLHRDTTLAVRDLGSRTGTRPDGVPVRGNQRLDDRDAIEIGRQALRLSLEGDDDARRA